MTSQAAPIVSQSMLSLMSAALVLCGEKPLQSTADPRYGAQVINALWDMVYETELQKNPWRFAMKKQALTQVNQQPINEWLYCFQIPTDCLLFHGFWGVGPDKLYDIYGDKIYCNINSGPTNPGVGTQLIGEYMFKPDPGTVPSYFSLLVALSMTQFISKPITENDTARTSWVQAYERQRATAMFIDAKTRPNRPLQHRPFIQIR